MFTALSFPISGQFQLRRESLALIVYGRVPEQDLLVDYIDQFNAAQHRIPWLENRRLILSLSPHAARAGP
jgi:hypothetical protein